VSVERATARILRNDVSHFNIGIGTFTSSGRPLVYGNNIHDNSVLGLILGFRTSLKPTTATAINNDIHGNGQGMTVFTHGSVVSDNRILDNGAGGLEAQPPASANEFVANVASACVDSTTGDGTAGTANTWTDNTGSPSIPSAICRRSGP
jgi:hypothetical protein